MNIPDFKEMEIIRLYTLLTYVDDIIIIGESRYNIKESIRKLKNPASIWN